MLAGSRMRDSGSMTANRSVSSEALLHELLPTVERSLDRHVNAATEWFPHEFVPYEEGRNFIVEPWKPADSHLPDVAQMALEVNLLTEDNLPYYHLAIWRTFGEDDVWGEWVRRWTAEEGRHAILLRDYLTVTRGVDPEKLEHGRMDMVQRGWQYPHRRIVTRHRRSRDDRRSQRGSGWHRRVSRGPHGRPPHRRDSREHDAGTSRRPYPFGRHMLQGRVRRQRITVCRAPAARMPAICRTSTSCPTAWGAIRA